MAQTYDAKIESIKQEIEQLKNRERQYAYTQIQLTLI